MSASPADALLQSLQNLAEVSARLNRDTREGDWDSAARLSVRIEPSFQAVVRAIEARPPLTPEQRQACRTLLQGILDGYREAGSRIAPWLQDVRLLLGDMA